MPASPFDSSHLSKLFDAGDTARLFSDSAEVRALLLVEGALAKVQGTAGLIPELSAAAIHRATLEIQIDPAGLAQQAGDEGDPVPALVTAFRALMQAPEHAQYLHWGADSQDIADTALMLRLRQVLGQYEQGLTRVLEALARLAQDHAATPMVAPGGAQAGVTSLGAALACRGWPLLDLAGALRAIRAEGLPVSLSGAGGTGRHLGPDPAALRAALAASLGMADPGRDWHRDRSKVLRLATWIRGTTGALADLAGDLLADLERGECTAAAGDNRIAACTVIALARQAVALDGSLQEAGSRMQADLATRFCERLSLPQLCLGLAGALAQANALLEGVTPDAAAMAARIEREQVLPTASSLALALTGPMSRSDAVAEVTLLRDAAQRQGTPLRDAVHARWPDLPDSLFDAAAQMAEAPAAARAFAAAVRAM